MNKPQEPTVTITADVYWKAVKSIEEKNQLLRRAADVLEQQTDRIMQLEAQLTTLNRLLTATTVIIEQVSDAKAKGLIDFEVDVPALTDALFALDNGFKL